MDILAEILIDIFMELMTLIVPEENISHRHKVIAGILSAVFALLVLGLFFFGAYLVFEAQNMIGIIPMVLAVAVSAVQITFGIVSYLKKK